MPSETSAVNAAYIEARMKQFKLVDMREQYQELIRVASEQSMTYEDFLIMLLQAEETGKKRRQAERLTDAANFDSDKRLSDIDYRFNPNLDAAKIQSLGMLEFMDNHENIIIIGPPGVGKSMIATGIGRNACEAGYKVLFMNAKELVDQLYEDMQKGYLKETLKRISKIPLLIIDELSYLKMDKERESLFFQIIRQRYEKSSLIITTNLPMGRWDELFTGKEIQCLFDNNPLMSMTLNNEYQMLPTNNSLITAKFTGMICQCISKYDIQKEKYTDILQIMQKENREQKSKIYTSSQEWYMDNNDELLQAIYELLKSVLQLHKPTNNICDIELLTSRGSLRFEYVYDILSYLESRLNIKINYMTVSRYDMLTVGTLTKFFKESGREYFEKV